MILYSCNMMQNSWNAELNTRKIRNIQKRHLMLMLSYDWTGPWGGCSIPGHQPEPSEHDEVPGQPQGSGPHQQDGHQVRGQTTGRRRGTHGRFITLKLFVTFNDLTMDRAKYLYQFTRAHILFLYELLLLLSTCTIIPYFCTWWVELGAPMVS